MYKQIDLSVCAIAVRIATRANNIHAIVSICLLSAKLGRIFIVKHSMIIFSVVDSKVALLTSDLAPT